MIKTKVAALLPNQRTELEALLKKRDPSEYVGDLSVAIPFLIMIPGAFLGLFAWFELAGTLKLGGYWTAARFPEYVLLYTAFFTAALVFAASLVNYAWTWGRHGYVLTGFGLVRVCGKRLVVIPYSSIEKVLASRVVTSRWFDPQTGETRSYDTGGDMKIVHRSKKFDLEVFIKDRVPIEIISFGSEAKALAFMDTLEKRRAQGTGGPDVRTVQWMPPAARWSLVTAASFLAALAFVLQCFFSWQNARVDALITDEAFNGRERTESNLSQSRERLARYVTHVKTGPHREAARERILAGMRPNIEARRVRLLKDHMTKFEYLEALRAYCDLCEPCPYAAELKALSGEEGYGITAWRALGR